MNWITLTLGEDIFYIPTENIAGIVINKTKPHSLSIMMVGDDVPTVFNFKNVQERDDKLREILRTNDSAIAKDTEPQEVN